MFMGVYGHTSMSNRDRFWMELKGLRDRWSGPSFMRGDFNMTRFVHAKNS